MNYEDIVAWTVKSFQLGDTRRSQALGEMVWGLLRCGVVTFAAIGRAMEGAAEKASKIRRVFEFCHNEHVDPAVVQQTLVQMLVGKALTTLGRLSSIAVVAIDWHEYDNGDVSGLRVSLMTGSRAIPLLWKEFRSGELKGRRTAIELEMLRDLERLRPPGCTWLMLLDSGFKAPSVIAMLDEVGLYVARSASNITVHSDRSCWTNIAKLPVSTGQLVEFGWIHWNRNRPRLVRLVACRLYDIRPPTPGRRRQRSAGRYKYTQPGLCAVITNLQEDVFDSLAVIRLYSRRFEIEHSFRNIKNATFGMNMEHAHLQEPETYSRLMCIVALTEALLWLVGSEAETQGLHLELTPSRPRDKHRVISLRNVGFECLEDTRINLPIDELVSRHLAPAMSRIFAIVGRTWRDVKTSLVLLDRAAVPQLALPLPTDNYSKRNKVSVRKDGRHMRCCHSHDWIVQQAAKPMAA